MYVNLTEFNRSFDWIWYINVKIYLGDRAMQTKRSVNLKHEDILIKKKVYEIATVEHVTYKRNSSRVNTTKFYYNFVLIRNFEILDPYITANSSITSHLILIKHVSGV